MSNCHKSKSIGDNIKCKKIFFFYQKDKDYPSVF